MPTQQFFKKNPRVVAQSTWTMPTTMPSSPWLPEPAMVGATVHIDRGLDRVSHLGLKPRSQPLPILSLSSFFALLSRLSPQNPSFSPPLPPPSLPLSPPLTAAPHCRPPPPGFLFLSLSPSPSHSLSLGSSLPLTAPRPTSPDPPYSPPLLFFPPTFPPTPFPPFSLLFLFFLYFPFLFLFPSPFLPNFLFSRKPPSTLFPFLVLLSFFLSLIPHVSFFFSLTVLQVLSHNPLLSGQ